MRQTILWMTKIKHRWWLITFSLTSFLICIVLNNLQIISQWTVCHDINVVLFRITMKWSRKQLIDLPRWLIPICDSKISLYPWEFIFMLSFITVWDGLRMAYQCDLYNWILTSVLWIVCLFTQWTLQLFWLSLLECLFVHTLKDSHFNVQPFKHQIPISFCKLSL